MSPDWTIFVDSSVLFAAALSRSGSARDLLLKDIEGEFALIVSEYVLMETERNILKKVPPAYNDFEYLRDQGMVSILSPGPKIHSRNCQNH